MGVGIPGSMRSYVSGLCAATAGLCAAGWLALAPVAFGYRDGAPGPGRAHGAALHRALLADWGTAAALAVVSLATLLAWIVAWRRRLRADGVLAGTSWREARALRRHARAREQAAAGEQAAADAAVPADGPADPARVLSELRALLIPLLAEPEATPPVHEPAAHQPVTPGPAVPLPRPGGLAAMESMLAGAELLMVACGEEEAW
jgi:hypothetical protein